MKKRKLHENELRCSGPTVCEDCKNYRIENLRHFLLIEAKRLQREFKKRNVNDCYCDQNSAAECPAHIDSYIHSLKRGKKN